MTIASHSLGRFLDPGLGLAETSVDGASTRKPTKGYLPSLDTLLTLPEQQKIQLKGVFAHEMERIMKFDRYLNTDRTDRIGLVSGNEITIFSSG